jgi:RND family efflux transporter MFP subunit
MTTDRRLDPRTAGLLVLVAVLGVAVRAALGTRDARAAEPPAAVPAGPAEAQPSAYPVVTVAPLPRSIGELVHAFGTVRPDARNAHTVTSATVAVISAVLALPGERVQRGQPLFRVEPDPLAYLAYQQAATAATLAGHEVERLTTEVADQLATTSQLDAARKSLLDANAAVEAARRQGATAGSSLIAAPVDGIVTAIGVAVGDRPAVGATLAVVVPGAEHVALGIEPGAERLVHVGDRVTVRAVQGDGERRTGRIRQVGAALDAESRLVPVSVVLEADGKRPYLSGIAVEGVIEAQPVAAYSLPRSALVKDEQGPAVFEVRGGKAHRVRVSVVSDEGPRVGVTGDLDAARPVVTTGAYELEEGVTVAERKP